MDELAEINLFTQVKLLRAIEGGGYMPVGGTDIKKSDARIIAATSRDLQDYVKKGLMREDFFYRIHIFPIYLPPLRERKEDIPLLIDHFMNIYQYKAKAPPITGKVLETFLCYDWPGNVRELENTLHRYVTLKKLDFLSPSLRESKEKRGNFWSDTSKEISDLGTVVANFEKQYIMNLLEQNQWHRTKVSAILGITRATLFNKMKAYGLNKKH